MPKPALHIITSRRPNRLDGPRDEPIHVGTARHVGDKRQRLAAGGDDLGGDRFEPIRAPRADRDRRAVAREPDRRRAPDARRRAGDRDDTHLVKLTAFTLAQLSALSSQLSADLAPALCTEAFAVHRAPAPCLTCPSPTRRAKLRDMDPAIRLLRDLVAINSVNPTLVAGAPGEAAIADFIAAAMRRSGLDVVVEPVAPGTAQRRRRASRDARKAAR